MPNGTCSIDGCGRPVVSRSMCSGCYQKWIARTAPHERPPVTLDIEHRYWAKVDQSAGHDGCWPWTAQLNIGGYGIFWDGTYNAKGQGRKVKATRWAWEQYIGPIPDGLLVCHTCDNPPCQNQRHHFLGTALDNNRDREQKGRGGGHKTAGSANGVAKLTDDRVAEIRRRYAAGGIAQHVLAAEYGVTQTLVSQIVRRIVWRHVA